MVTYFYTSDMNLGIPKFSLNKTYYQSIIIQSPKYKRFVKLDFSQFSNLIQGKSSAKNFPKNTNWCLTLLNKNTNLLSILDENI